MSSPLKTTRTQLADAQGHYKEAATAASEGTGHLKLDQYTEITQGIGRTQERIASIRQLLGQVSALAETTEIGVRHIIEIASDRSAAAKIGLVQTASRVTQSVGHGMQSTAQALQGASPNLPHIQQMNGATGELYITGVRIGQRTVSLATALEGLVAALDQVRGCISTTRTATNGLDQGLTTANSLLDTAQHENTTAIETAEHLEDDFGSMPTIADEFNSGVSTFNAMT